MSVQSQHKEFILYNKAKELIQHTLKVTGNSDCFPKRVRWTLCQRIQDTALQIMRDILLANETTELELSKERLALQKSALTHCKLLMSLIEISFEQGYINARRAEYWGGLTLDIKRMCAAWRKKDAFRLNIS